ncbi:MAG: carboxylating nicotinate-nucleotide diphosphorylase [Eubacterium sp.]|nr:carboxylating nicotinate-nucleotide diphosphorylase [Eubacterium sp.]
MNSGAGLNFNIDAAITAALREDITSEDITTNAVMPEAKAGKVDLICKEAGVLAGIEVFKRTFTLLDPQTKFDIGVTDGEAIEKGQTLGSIIGDIRCLLMGERTALNYLQRMSGIATHTRRLAAILVGSGTKLLDTRKTTPNMRYFEKYAVKIGGGYNHRYNLSDGILLKDNHIGAAGSVARAVAMAREYAPFVRKIEVEVESLEMLAEALEAGADIVMLDNMDTETMARAVAMARGRAVTECSGNVDEARLREIAGIGVDYVSCGALTHSSKILDFSMKNLKPLEENANG